MVHLSGGGGEVLKKEVGTSQSLSIGDSIGVGEMRSCPPSYKSGMG